VVCNSSLRENIENLISKLSNGYWWWLSNFGFYRHGMRIQQCKQRFSFKESRVTLNPDASPRVRFLHVLTNFSIRALSAKRFVRNLILKQRRTENATKNPTWRDINPCQFTSAIAASSTLDEGDCAILRIPSHTNIYPLVSATLAQPRAIIRIHVCADRYTRCVSHNRARTWERDRKWEKERKKEKGYSPRQMPRFRFRSRYEG